MTVHCLIFVLFFFFSFLYSSLSLSLISLQQSLLFPSSSHLSQSFFPWHLQPLKTRWRLVRLKETFILYSPSKKEAGGCWEGPDSYGHFVWMKNTYRRNLLVFLYHCPDIPKLVLHSILLKLSPIPGHMVNPFVSFVYLDPSRKLPDST